MEKVKIPVSFELNESIANVIDSRFMAVKIYVAHVGENRNRSIFTKEVLQNMISSLSNIPILGYLKQEEGELDFKGHEEKLVIEDNSIRLKYFGHAYGLIPESSNARFEFRYGEDGIEREYLVVDGLLWRKFDDIISIFDRDGGFKGQSLELEASSVEGYHDEYGMFVFTSAKFEGLCILGEDVTPAMIGSTIERFSVNDIRNEFSEMLDEFNTYFSAINKKGDVGLEKEKVIPTEFEDDKKKEDEELEEEEVGKDEDDSEDEEKKNFEKGDDEEEPVVKDEDEEEKKNKNFVRTFELSHDDIRTNIYRELDKVEQFSNSWYWITKVFDSYAIVDMEDDNKFIKVNYVKHETGVTIGETEEVFPMFVNANEKTALEMTRNSFEAMKAELDTLKTFKANIELDEKEQKLSQYSAILSEEEYEGIKSNLTKFSMEDIEKEIGFMLLKKNHFSHDEKKQDEKSRVMATPKDENNNPYGSLSNYFTKL